MYYFHISQLLNEYIAESLIGKLAVVNISGNATHVRTAKTTFKMCTLQMFKWSQMGHRKTIALMGNKAEKPYNLMGNRKIATKVI